MATKLTRLNQLVRAGEIVDGAWRLTRGHELQYRRRGRREELILSGPIIAAEPNGLVFRAMERSDDGAVVSRLLMLRGRWQADLKNRLTFLVERQTAQPNRLTFRGGWEVGPGHQISYRHDQIDLKTKRRRIQTLTFQGYWDLADGNRLAYVLDRDSDSAFRFRGAFQTPSILAKTGQIRYQVGVELKGKRQLHTIALFGRWKLGRDLSLEFEVTYGDGSRRAIAFGASYSVVPGGTIQARLIGREGKPLGVELLFTREFLKDAGEAFLRMRRSIERDRFLDDGEEPEETAVEGGFRFRW